MFHFIYRALGSLNGLAETNPPDVWRIKSVGWSADVTALPKPSPQSPEPGPFFVIDRAQVQQRAKDGAGSHKPGYREAGAGNFRGPSFKLHEVDRREEGESTG